MCKKKQDLNSLVLHQKMFTFLRSVLKDKQVENYNIFSSLEYIYRMIHNQRFYLDNLDSCLACVEGHIVSDSKKQDLSDPLGSSAK